MDRADSLLPREEDLRADGISDSGLEETTVAKIVKESQPNPPILPTVLTSFTLFPKLPIEIRFIIYHMVVDKPCLLSYYVQKREIPALYLVSKEARDEIKKHLLWAEDFNPWSHHFRAVGDRTWGYINPEYDVMRVGIGYFINARSDTSGLRTLALLGLWQSHMLAPSVPLFSLLSSFHNQCFSSLKEVLIVRNLDQVNLRECPENETDACGFYGAVNEETEKWIQMSLPGTIKEDVDTSSVEYRSTAWFMLPRDPHPSSYTLLSNFVEDITELNEKCYPGTKLPDFRVAYSRYGTLYEEDSEEEVDDLANGALWRDIWSRTDCSALGR